MSASQPTHGDESYADQVRRQLQTRCIRLMTKEAFIGIPSEHEQAFEGDEAIFWCDETGEALGPDGSTACEADCHGPGRSCYQAPERFDDPT